MRRLYPDIPDEWHCEVFGYIIESDDAGDLGEDMLTVQLPNGILVHAGWSSEMDPKGHYVVSATCGLDEMIPPIETDDADQARAEVVRLVDAMRQDATVSDSDNTFVMSSHDRPMIEYVTGGR